MKTLYHSQVHSFSKYVHLANAIVNKKLPPLNLKSRESHIECNFSPTVRHYGKKSTSKIVHQRCTTLQKFTIPYLNSECFAPNKEKQICFLIDVAARSARNTI